MPAHPTPYLIAQRVMNALGPQAEAFASLMFRHRLDQDDVQQAGIWLAIGNAINDLERLPPPGKRH
jgi:hypothetical protein